MCNRGVDLARIPQSGPFMNYRNWLDWKLRNMQCGESVQLPIFSAIVIERYQDGFALTFGSQLARGFAVSDSVLTYIEYHIYQPDEDEKRLARNASIKNLHLRGATKTEITQKLKISFQLVSYHIMRLTAA